MKPAWRSLLVAPVGHLAAAIAVSFTLATPAWSYQDEPQLIEDFMHFTMIARPELAADYAQQILDAGLSDAELAIMLDEGNIDLKKFDGAIARARSIDVLEDVATRLATRIERGRLDLARDPQRIDQAIQMLMGHQRQQMMAENRLLAAGEHAVPALLNQVASGDDERLKSRCQKMLVEIGRLSVTPLTVALSQVDPGTQRTICQTLGEIGWQHAAPSLKELAEDSNAPAPVRESAMAAFARVGGIEADVSSLYASLARQYFDGNESLIAYPYESTNIVWGYDAFVGLVATPVPTEIVAEVLAMQNASRAISIDQSNSTALGLFVAANLRRENRLPDGQADPVFGDNAYTPDFYATVFGTQICLDVLAMAIDAVDTPLVRDALMALAQTTGGSNLFTATDGRRPLLEALSYPERRVQYEAALILGRALPREAFEGDVKVVPLLSSAVRTGNTAYAAVVADEDEDRRGLESWLDGMGYQVVASSSNLDTLRGGMADAAGIDLVVIRRMTPDSAMQTVDDLRRTIKTSAAPMVVVATGPDSVAVEAEYRTDAQVKVWRPVAGVGAAEFGAAVDEVVNRMTGGRMSDADAEIYAIEALSAMRDIAITNCPVYSMLDAETALLDAMDTREGGTRLLVASILAMIDSERAQRALFDVALADMDYQIDLLDHVTDSVKRYGDRSATHHRSALVELIRSNDTDLADAAARLHGAMNLSSPDALTLIP